MSESEATLNLDSFPKLKKNQRRRLYFDTLTKLDSLALESRGYVPVVLKTMPDTSNEERIEYLHAILQGFQDGTVYCTKERLSAVKAEMQARGMLDKKSMNFNLKVKAESIKELYNWGNSRHTLQGNATIVDPRRVDAAQFLEEPVKKGKK